MHLSLFISAEHGPDESMERRLAEHIEQARLHATVEEGHKCGCPLNDDYAKIIDQVESGNIVDEGH